MPALYRKFRPVSFDGVIGQQNITEALKNQIKTGRIGHAYLFTGSRGTGKTTCAKIFAKALNCLSPDNGSPCGKCEVCKQLNSADSVDIIELDAASNNGVDEIREIREKVKYAPVAASKKVYIIDEAHMLTTGAFNALLKTLEEPPAHAVFILATTEPHKLPATILSRCMRFDFKLIPTELIENLIASVYGDESVEYDAQAVKLIAKAGEGSVRDALSVADRCMSTGEKVTYELVADILGVSGWEVMSKLVADIASGDVGKCFMTLDKLALSGKSMSLIAKELTSYARDLLAVKSGGRDSVIAGEDKMNALTGEQENYSAATLINIMNAFGALDMDLRYSVNPRIAMECALVSACCSLGNDSVALIARIDKLEKRIEEIESKAIGVKKVELSPVMPMRQAAPVAPTNAFAVWGTMLTYLRKNASMVVYTASGEQDDVTLENSVLTVYAKDDDAFMVLSTPEAAEALDRAAKSVNPDIEVKIDKRKEAINMDSEIARIKAIAGNAKININKR